jgi:F-type H+-transporting ATPase subunit delta
MKSSDRVLAGRYAAALFQAAAGKGEEQKVSVELASAGALLSDRDAALRHPRVSLADKKKLVHAALDGKAGPTLERFIELLLEKKRYELFALIAADYAKLAEDKRGVAKARVRTAKPLTAAEQKTLAASLKTFAGKDIELEIKEDTELIGGVAVKIGDWVLDSSLRGQLRRLRESFN